MKLINLGLPWEVAHVEKGYEVRDRLRRPVALFVDWRIAQTVITIFNSLLMFEDRS